MRRCVFLVSVLVAAALIVPAPSSLWASAEEGHGSAAKGEGKKDKNKIENGILNYGPVTVNVLSNKGYRILRLVMEIHCEDNAAAERLTLPDVKEAVMMLLSTRVGEDLLPATGKMVLRKDLLELFGQYAGQGKVKELYFTEFVLQ